METGEASYHSSAMLCWGSWFVSAFLKASKIPKAVFVLAQRWGSENVRCVEMLLISKVQREEKKRESEKHARERHPQNDTS